MLKSIDINKIKHRNICIIGRRYSGKSTLCIDILKKISKNENIITVIIGDPELILAYPYTKIISKLSIKVLDDLCKHLRYRITNIDDVELRRIKHLYLIIEDDISVSETCAQKIFRMLSCSEHYYMSIIYITTNIKLLDRSIEHNFDYYFITSPFPKSKLGCEYLCLFGDEIPKKQIISYSKDIFRHNSYSSLVYYNYHRKGTDIFSYYRVDLKPVRMTYFQNFSDIVITYSED